MSDDYLILSRKEVGSVKALNSVHKVCNYHPWKIEDHEDYYLSYSFLRDKDCAPAVRQESKLMAP